MVDAVVTPHVVVFSELSPKARVQYTRFLLENDVKVLSLSLKFSEMFSQRPSDNRFVANIRLVKASCNPLGSIDTSNQNPDEAPGLDEEERPIDQADVLDSRLAAVPEALRPYASLIFLIGERRSRPKTDPDTYTKETRLVRMIDEIYDARYEDLSASSNTSAGNFAKFIRHYLTNRFGLKRLVDQQAWDLIEGLSALQHRVDVELFSCFLQGKYPESTLAFFLFARSSLQRLLCSTVYRPMSVKPASAPERKQRKPSTTPNSLLVWLSKTQAETLAQTVFGSKTEDTYIEFMHAMKAFLSCNSSITRTRTPAHFVDANEFLFIAAETYHKSSTSFPGAGLDHCEEIGDSSPTGQAVTPQTFARLQAVPGQILAAGGQHLLEAAVETASSTGAVVLEGTEDEDDAQLQTRLGSLLERMKKRQQSTGL